MENYVGFVLGQYASERRKVLQVPVMEDNPVHYRLDILPWRPPPHHAAKLDLAVMLKYVLGKMASHKACYACYECFHIRFSFQYR